MSNLNCLLVEQLTRDAIEAARDGKWDQVMALYERRVSEGQLEHLSPNRTKALLRQDQWLITRVREAQAAIKKNLLAIEDQRRQLEILKRQWGGNSTVQARHLLTI